MPSVTKTNLSLALVGLGILVMVIAVILLLPNASEPAADPNDVTIVTTIFPLADIARQIAGDRANVVQLLPAGAAPHSHTLTPRQLASIQNARVAFIIGHGLDNWATEAINRVADLPIITVDQNIALREFGAAHENDDDHKEDTAESIDPHYWLTVPNAQTIAATITHTLQDIDPAGSEHYQQNLLAYNEQLDQLEQELQAQAAAAPTKEFIAIHDAWSYLAANYGFKLVASYEPIEGRQPSIADIRRLQNLIAELGITTFYTEPQKQLTGTTRFLQEDLGLAIAILDPIGGLADRDSYQNLMRANLKALTQQSAN